MTRTFTNQCLMAVQSLTGNVTTFKQMKVKAKHRFHKFVKFQKLENKIREEVKYEKQPIYKSSMSDYSSIDDYARITGQSHMQPIASNNFATINSQNNTALLLGRLLYEGSSFWMEVQCMNESLRLEAEVRERLQLMKPRIRADKFIQIRQVLRREEASLPTEVIL